MNNNNNDISDDNSNTLFLDFQLLPLVLDILSVLRESQDDLEIARVVSVFNDRVARCQRILDELPGVELSRAQQLEKYQSFENSIAHKTQLIQKYSQLDVMQRDITEKISVDNSDNGNSNESNDLDGMKD